LHSEQGWAAFFCDLLMKCEDIQADEVAFFKKLFLKKAEDFYSR
jgi:hypothetical protein